MNDRHNLVTGVNLPFAEDASASELGAVLQQLAKLGGELSRPLETEDQRLGQYREAVFLAQWVTRAGESLAASLSAELALRNGGAR